MSSFLRSDSDSEFGYDFSPDEERLLLQLGSDYASSHQDPAVAVIDSIPGKTDNGLERNDNGAITVDNTKELASPNPEEYILSPLLLDRIPEMVSIALDPGTLHSPVPYNGEVVYPALATALRDIKVKETTDESRHKTSEQEKSEDDGYEDDRTPLQRFRSYPRRPLTVTDLTAGAWCELQYWYTLTRLPGGRRTKTAAMRKGSAIHQKLEDETHTTVKIEILTKEDGFGLRLWNVIQGLRTLRETGLAREIEVWGNVNGNLVNGKIDSLSYKSPNPEFEEELSSQDSSKQKQSTLKEFFEVKSSGRSSEKKPLVYLADVKTRGSLAPITPALVRPAKIQLMLYRQMLAEMATGKLSFTKVCRRYGLDMFDTFSDSFIAQIAGIHEDVFDDGIVDAEKTNQDEERSGGASDILKYRTLRELINLVEDELKLTFPHGEDSIGTMLRVEYVHRDDGRTLHCHDFPLSKPALQKYLVSYIGWWQGDREAKGVDIEEAFKCRSCEFVAECSWRKRIDDESVKTAQAKLIAHRKTATD